MSKYGSRTRSQAAKERTRGWKSPEERKAETEYLRQKYGRREPSPAPQHDGEPEVGA